MPTTTSPEAAAYATAVRFALADVEPRDLRALLDGLDDHLAEVAADGDVSLIDVLGPADVYAAELRASAGLTTRVMPFAPPSVATPLPVVGSTPAPPTAQPAEVWAPITRTRATEFVARTWLVAVATAVVVAVAMARSDIGADRVMLGSAIVGLLCIVSVLAVRHARLSSSTMTRVAVAMRAVTIVGAVWAGGQLGTGSARDVVSGSGVDGYPEPATTLVLGDPFVTITVQASPVVPNVVGLPVDQAIQLSLTLH